MQRRFERQWQRVHRATLREASPGADVTEDPAHGEERDKHLDDLCRRFAVQAELRPVALLHVETPVLLCDVDLRRRTASRRLELEYDAATRAFVPPRCDGCGGPAPQPAACDDELHLLCESCLPSASGRPSCPACK